ncbi:MAG: hypothetical protein ACK5KP_04495 [Paludibacteraceae bacterium]
MTKTKTKGLQRAKELRRQAWTTSTEAKALELAVGETTTEKCLDLESYARLKTRISRLKDKTGQVFSTELSENDVIITRFDDVEIQ